MATLIGTYYGPWVGPSANKQFRTVAQFQYTETNDSGWYVQGRYWMEVSNLTDVYVWANITVGWLDGTLVGVSSSGTYADTGWVDWGWVNYGETFDWSCSAHYYSSSYTLYESTVTTTSYTVPLPTYTVAYNANGGSGAPSSQTKTHGVDLKLRTTIPTKPGHTFLGWSDTSSGEKLWDAGGTYTWNKSCTLYAVWQIKTYPVTYKANGGTGAPAAQTKTHGTTLKLSTATPTRYGYEFLGWATSETGSVAYHPGGNYTNNAEVTLYAVWEQIVHTVTFDASTNGGSVSETSRKVSHGNVIGTMPVADRQYYKFVGWFTHPVGGTQVLANAAVISDMTLYAQYVIDASLIEYRDGKHVSMIVFERVSGEWVKVFSFERVNGEWQQGVGG